MTCRGACVTKTAEQRIDDFIERMGLSIQEEGLPRIAGRMFGLFIVHGGPLGIDDIAGRLHVSRASVSTNGRLLRELGFLERVVMPGDRRDYYRLTDTPYARLLDGYVVRIAKRLDLVREMDASLAGDPPDGAHARLAALADFYEQVMASTSALAERVQVSGGST